MLFEESAAAALDLDAAREAFHDVGRNRGHEAEVEEDEAARRVVEHQVALVRVCVDVAACEEAWRGCGKGRL